MKENFKMLVDDFSCGWGRMVSLRLPWLILGAVGGLGTSFFVSKFENLLSQEIALTFFVPVIIYMSDAVGTQAETIFVRYLKDNDLTLAVYFKYLAKELIIGCFMGVILGLLVGTMTLLWLEIKTVALIVGLAMAMNIMIAPLVATTVAAILSKKGADPALGAGPFTTVIQDFISLLIYFLVAVVVFKRC